MSDFHQLVDGASAETPNGIKALSRLNTLEGFAACSVIRMVREHQADLAVRFAQTSG